jgi:hypothetical protein
LFLFSDSFFFFRTVCSYFRTVSSFFERFVLIFGQFLLLSNGLFLFSDVLFLFSDNLFLFWDGGTVGLCILQEGADLMVNDDSQSEHKEWVSALSGAVNTWLVHSPNIHEIRGYNKLAKLANSEIVAFMQVGATLKALHHTRLAIHEAPHTLSRPCHHILTSMAPYTYLALPSPLTG